MTIINDLGFFFTAFGRVLEILGAVLLIAGPSVSIGVFIGIRWRKKREFGELTDARSEAKAARAEMAEIKHAQTRARRLLESAGEIEIKAADLMTAAKTERRLGVEILKGNAGLSGFLGPVLASKEADG